MKLKLLYSPSYVEALADAFSSALSHATPGIDRDAFVRGVLGSGWRALELKQRMRRIAQSLADHVPGEYRDQLATVLEVAPQFDGFRAMMFPDFVELRRRGRLRCVGAGARCAHALLVERVRGASVHRALR